MGVIVVSADIISFVLVLILLCGSVFGSADRDKTSALYRACLLAVLVGIIGDAFSYMTAETRAGLYGILLADLIGYLMCPVLLVLYACYLVSIIEKTAPVPRWAVLPAAAFGAADVIMCLVGVFNGKFLYFADHTTELGEWGDYTSILLFLGILYLYYVLFCYRKALSREQILGIAVFMLFPIVDSWSSLLVNEIDLTYPILALAFMLVYVILQERTIAEDNMRRKIFLEDAKIDPQTRMKNRQAFSDFVRSTERGKAKVVVYCSMNHLGEIRETEGPEAVDKAVSSFAGILKEQFGEGEICRVSDREFAVFLYQIREEVLKKKLRAFEKTMEGNNGMAAFGYVYSEEEPLLDMIREAKMQI